MPCPECATSCPIADHAAERTWRHLDTMQFETLIRGRVPRCQCPQHGVETIRVPRAEPGARFTLLFEQFAMDVLLASRSLTQAAALLRLDWDAVQRIMERAVARGLAQRQLDELKHVSMDEKSFRSGRSYVSLLTDLDRSRVLEVMEGCDQAVAEALWNSLTPEQRAPIEYAYEGSARRFFKQWFGWATRSQLKPIRKVARMIRQHLEPS